jgi:hypothetical protein
MFALFNSTEFWFGLVVLSAYQCGKFRELNLVDPSVTERSSVIPNLRASDFAGKNAYVSSLIVFLLATFVGYTLLCAASPTVLRGWFEVTKSPVNTADFVNKVPYPLYIAAAFMGLTQSAIPGFAALGDFQKNFFHFWIGVPRKVIDTAATFSEEIIAKTEDNKEQLYMVIRQLLSARWKAKIDKYADLVFYEYQIRRMKLDETDVLDDIKSGSTRELQHIIEQLVYAAAIAAVRETGGKALDELAADLDVPIPGPRYPYRNLALSALVFIVCLTLLWFAVPMSKPIVESTIGSASAIYWPADLATSGQYLLAHSIPIFCAIGLMLMMKSNSRSQKFERYPELIISVIVLVVVYDYLQALFDYGYFSKVSDGDVLSFFVRRLPFNIHSLISCFICVIILMFLENSGKPGILNSKLFAWLALVLSTILVSSFYAFARLKFQFNGFSPDFMICVVTMNVIVASISFVAVEAYARYGLSKAKRVA